MRDAHIVVLGGIAGVHLVELGGCVVRCAGVLRTLLRVVGRCSGQKCHTRRGQGFLQGREGYLVEVCVTIGIVIAQGCVPLTGAFDIRQGLIVPLQIRVAQFALEHLANLAAWQCRGQDDIGHALGFAHALVHKLTQALGTGVAVDPSNHKGHGRFAPLMGGNPHHGTFLHTGMLSQFGFDVRGVDIEATRDDHVLFPIPQNQESVGIKTTDVARANESLARGVIPLHLPRFLGHAVIAFHDGGRMTHHLAALAGLHLHALLIDQPNVMARRRATHGVQLVRVVMGIQLGTAPTFGHAVVLGEPSRPALEHLPLQVGTERSAGDKLGLKATQVVSVELWEIHQSLVLHRYQHGVRGTVGLCQFKVGPHLKLGHQNAGAPQAQGGNEGNQRGVGVQRRGHQVDGVGVVAVGVRPLNLRPTHAPGLQDAFGHTGGAGGVNEVERPIRLRLHRGGARRCASFMQPGGPGLPGITVVQCHAGPVLLCRGRESVATLSVQKQIARLRVVQHGRQMRRR